MQACQQVRCACVSLIHLCFCPGQPVSKPFEEEGRVSAMNEARSEEKKNEKNTKKSLHRNRNIRKIGYFSFLGYYTSGRVYFRKR